METANGPMWATHKARVYVQTLDVYVEAQVFFKSATRLRRRCWSPTAEMPGCLRSSPLNMLEARKM